MKNNNMRPIYIFFILLLIGAPVYGNRKGVVFYNISTQQTGESLRVTFDMESPRGVVGNRQSLLIYPKLSTGREEKILSPIELMGRKRARTVNRKEKLLHMNEDLQARLMIDAGNRNQLVRYALDIPYEAWMANAEMWVNEELIDCGKLKAKGSYKMVSGQLSQQARVVVNRPAETQNTRVMVNRPAETHSNVVVNPPVSTTRTTPQVTPPVVTQPPVQQQTGSSRVIVNRPPETTWSETPVKTAAKKVLQPQAAYKFDSAKSSGRTEEGQAFLDFRAAESQILPHYRRNPEELSRIRESIIRTIRTPGAEIRAIYLTGWASPEGQTQMNERLAHSRAEALKNYLTRQLQLPLGLIQIRRGGEDLDGLRRMIEESNMPDKEWVLMSLERMRREDWTENQLRTVLGRTTYRYLDEQMFPKLRRVDYSIEYTIRDGYTPSSGRQFSEQQANRLSKEELYRTASEYTPGTEEWNQIILLIGRLHPMDEEAAINASAIHLGHKEFYDAYKCLEPFRNTFVPEIMNNLAIWHLWEGDTDRAKQLFTSAANAGLEEAKNNLRMME